MARGVGQKRAVFPPEVEQTLTREFFGDAQRGFFVEVGANHPRDGSQTWHLEQAGWTGVLIEPQPDLAERLRQARQATVFAVACSSPSRSGMMASLNLAGPLSSLEPELLAPGLHSDGAINVPVLTLDEVLTKAGAPVPIDFLSIDVEGHEIDVLAGFDIGRWHPRLVLLEDHVCDLAKHRAMTRAGYRLVRRTGLNGWYVPAGEDFAVSWLGRWQLLRKYYLSLPCRSAQNAKRRLRDRIRGTRSATRGLAPERG